MVGEMDKRWFRVDEERVSRGANYIPVQAYNSEPEAPPSKLTGQREDRMVAHRPPGYARREEGGLTVS